MLFDQTDQIVRVCLTSKEEFSVLFAKHQQSAERTDGSSWFRLPTPIDRLTANRCSQKIQLLRISGIISQIDPH